MYSRPNSRLNVNAMRPWLADSGETRIAIGNGRSLVVNAPAALRYDEWKDIDRAVVEVAVDRLVGVNDLISRGLVHNLGSIGQTIALWERSSSMTGATLSMSGPTRSEKDEQQFDYKEVPVPVVHKDFSINLRRLEASRLLGEGVDVTQASVASRIVAEATEDMLFSGSTIKVAGATISGYLTHADRNTVGLTEQWTAAGKTGAEILADVQAMLVTLRADRYFGPFTLYIPGAYEGVLDNDFNPATSDTRTVRERILQLEGIQDIRVADRQPNHNVLLVQMTRDVVDMAIAQDIKTVQWQAMGGMVEEFHVMAVWVPRVKSTFDGQSGICHLS